jgi:hypothetical protein
VRKASRFKSSSLLMPYHMGGGASSVDHKRHSEQQLSTIGRQAMRPSEVIKVLEAASTGGGGNGSCERSA